MNKTSILQLIELGELETAVSQYIEMAKATRHETLALQLSSRLANLNNEELAGKLSFDERSRQRSQISHSLIQLVQQFEGERAAGGSFFSKNWVKLGAAVVFTFGILANFGAIKQALWPEKSLPAATDLPAAKPVEPTIHQEGTINVVSDRDVNMNIGNGDWEKATQIKAKIKSDSLKK